MDPFLYTRDEMWLSFWLGAAAGIAITIIVVTAFGALLRWLHGGDMDALVRATQEEQ